MSPQTTLLLGAKYAILRSEFRLNSSTQRSFPPVARKILVTMGGADSTGATYIVVEALHKAQEAIGIAWSEPLEGVVVAGPYMTEYSKLQSATAPSSIKLRVEATPNNLGELMSWADVAVSAGGTTSLELAHMGVPAILLALAENQKALVSHLVDKGIAKAPKEPTSTKDLARDLVVLGLIAERARHAAAAGATLCHLTARPL